MIAYLGQLAGLDYVRDVMAVAQYQGNTCKRRRTLDPYRASTSKLTRSSCFSGSPIRRLPIERARFMDGIQKLPQRIFAGRG
ncbi:hypothetical protein ACLJYM_27910 [Rhizobium giardinii]|uniref:hypothetical protein n=1 Tax=Rhizobium giardinii TaxID=56731 RepID=UPI0039E1FD0C